VKLSEYGTEYYRLTIRNEPEDLTWTASFDGGKTYVDGEYDEESDVWRWLVSGPKSNGAGTVLLKRGTVRPLIKAEAGAESVVRIAPTIKVL
jgi:hypothetical protein